MQSGWYYTTDLWVISHNPTISLLVVQKMWWGRYVTFYDPAL